MVELMSYASTVAVDDIGTDMLRYASEHAPIEQVSDGLDRILRLILF